MVPFWIPIMIRHVIFRIPKKDHNYLNLSILGLRALGFRGLGFRGLGL